jgi:hypothetical protein
MLPRRLIFGTHDHAAEIEEDGADHDLFLLLAVVFFAVEEVFGDDLLVPAGFDFGLAAGTADFFSIVTTGFSSSTSVFVDMDGGVEVETDIGVGGMAACSCAACLQFGKTISMR